MVGSLRALVAKRDWDEIAEVAKARKSPIGWEVSVFLFFFSSSSSPLSFNPNSDSFRPLGEAAFTEWNA